MIRPGCCESRPRSNATWDQVRPVEVPERRAGRPAGCPAAAPLEYPAAARRSHQVRLPCATASQEAADVRTCSAAVQMHCRWMHGSNSKFKIQNAKSPFEFCILHFALMLSRFFHTWERRLASVTKDRVVRPFDWGKDWIELPGPEGPGLPLSELRLW